MTEGHRILIALWDGGGVVPPILGVARRLAERGHRVYVLGDPTIEAEATAVGAAFLPWTQAPHRTSRAPSADIIRDYAYSSQRTFFKEEFRGYFIDSGPRWTADVCQAIDDNAIEVVLCDFMIPWAAVAAESRGIPCTVLVTFPYPIPTKGFPPQGSALVPVPSVLRAPRDAALRRMTEWFYDRWLGVLNEVRRSLGMAPLRHALDQVRSAAAVCVLTAADFDNPRSPAPANIHWAGPQLDDPGWVEDWRDPWPAGDPRPLVVGAMSSTFQDHAGMLRSVVEALSGLPVRGVVSLGPTISASEVPGAPNVAVVPSVPHAEVLPHAAVVVTHCGHGTTMKALAAGVPMVCMPIARDQTDNAARVVALGAGVRLKPRARPEAIRAAVERVLGDPSFSIAAQAAAARMATHIREDDVVLVVERTLGSPQAVRAD